MAKPWGHEPSVLEAPVALWLVAAPVIAGIWNLRMGWFVPICCLVALLVSQPFGGVEWWSLKDNEGPIIVFFGVPTFAAGYGVGRFFHILITEFRK